MNSNNDTLVCLPPPSTAEARDSTDTRRSKTPTPPERRVLLLEDNVELAELLRFMFEMWEFQPTVANLGQKASRLLEEQQFHLAVVDIDLPDTTGFEVVADASARGWLQNTKIIFCSASDNRVAMARQFPGSVFLPKPFEMQSLLELIRRLFPNEPVPTVSLAGNSVYE